MLCARWERGDREEGEKVPSWAKPYCWEGDVWVGPGK